MEEMRQDFNLIGFQTFDSKDKTRKFYVAQCYTNQLSNDGLSNRAVVVNVFVTQEEYTQIMTMPIGSPIMVDVIPNLSSGKINYKINLQ